MTPDFGHGESVGIKDLIGPEANRLFKDCLVENVIVAKISILATDTRIVFEEIVDVELVECEEGGVGLWVDNDCLFKHELCQTGFKVEASAQTGYHICLCQVATVWIQVD